MATQELATGLVQVPEETKRTANKVGYLVKQGGNWKTWKRRYFVLKDNYLYYFGDPRDVTPKGVIVLEGTIVETTSDQKRKFCFCMKSKKSFTANHTWANRTYYVQAAKEDEMDAWIKALQRANPGSKAPHTQKMSDDTRKLFKACGKGDVTTVKAILSANKTLDLSSMDEEGNTPMHFAAVGGHVDVVKILIEHGANVEVKSRDGFTPMHSVAQGDHHKVLELLFEKGAHVDTPNTFDNGNTTLHYAACWGATECTKVLLKNKATVDAKAHDQSTPLSFAAEKGHLQIAKLLVEAGASLESKNDPEEKGGATPLLLACHNGQIDVLKFLIEKGANVKEKTIDGLNAIHLAIRSGSDNEELIRILLDAGAECNGKTNNGDTPLHYAAYMGYVQSTQLLIEKGARLEEQGQNSSTPLHFAAREGKTDVVKLLVGKGAFVDSKDKDGDTPLQCALINEHTQCAEYLRSIEVQKKAQS